MSPEGDSLWGRYYHYIVSPAERHYLNDIQATPDGGYIMGGEATLGFLGNPITEPIQQTWLVKVDEYGCLVPGCHLRPVTTAIEETDIQLDLDLYPNPASDYLNIWLRSSKEHRDGVFVITNHLGQIVQTFKSKGRDDTYIVSLSEHPSGMYWLQYQLQGEIIKSLGFVVKH